MYTLACKRFLCYLLLTVWVIAMEKKTIKLKSVLIVTIIEIALILISACISIVILNSDVKNYQKENQVYIEHTFDEYQKRIQEREEAFTSNCLSIEQSRSFNALKSGKDEADYLQKAQDINDVEDRLLSLVQFHPIARKASIYISSKAEDIYITTDQIESEKVIFRTFLSEENNRVSFRLYQSDIYFVYGNRNSGLFTIQVDDFYLLDLFSRIGTLYDKNNAFKCVENGKAYFVTTNRKRSDSEFLSSRPKYSSGIQGNHIVYISKYFDLVDLYVLVSLQNQRTERILPPLVLRIVICLFEAVASVFLTYRIAGRPRKTVLSARKKIEDGNFDVRIEEKSSIKDFSRLYNGFNQRTSSLNQYVNENYIQQLRIQESEFRYLQSQINPHFLYNCFANISSLCQIGEIQKAGERTNDLSKYYYYITNKEPVVTLREEYENRRQFIRIQEIRFGDRVSFDIQPLDDTVSEIKVPKLIFQPICENSYKYVFSKIAKGGHLFFHYSLKDGQLIVEIGDNGNLLDDSRIESLNQRISSSSVIGQHGLTNISRRLQFFSSAEDNVVLKKNEKGGLSVILKIKTEVNR